MSFFGLFNYNKPGPGVRKDVYEPPMKIFFGVFFRKFWKMISLNIMYFISTLPIWFLLFLPTMLSEVTDENILSNYNSQILIFMLIAVVGLPVFNTGFAYILRNFSRQNHAWIWHDFWDKVKSNFKQSIALTVIDIVVLFVGVVNVTFYSNNEVINGNVAFLLKSIVVMTFGIYYMMHYFIYTIMVTFDLNLKGILKNSLILTFVKLPRNIGITLLIYIIGALLFGISSGIGVLLCVIIACIFVNYIATFNAVSLVDKYLMPFDDEDDEDESCFSDEQLITDKEAR